MRLIFPILLCLLPLFASAQEKMALVIGNQAYETLESVQTDSEDARNVAQALTAAGFDTVTLHNSDGTDLRTALDDFAFRSETADFALIYYAGHGADVAGENVFFPVDAKIGSPEDVEKTGVTLGQLQDAVAGARRGRLILLDCCLPLGGMAALEAKASEGESREVFRSDGLAPATPPLGTMVMFASKDGEPILKSAGKHSYFLQALVDNLTTTDLEAALAVKKVIAAVVEASDNMQTPKVYGSFFAHPSFASGGEGGSSDSPTADRRAAWAALEDGQAAKYAEMAEAGDVRAMLASAYVKLAPDDPRYAPEEAADLLQRAAADGSVEAQFELAQLYERGLGVVQDSDRAMELYRAAAEQEYPPALNDLGFLYSQGGLNIGPDQARSLVYFERAAEAGHPHALFRYAALINDGNIKGKGPQDAARYLYRALRLGAQEVYTLLREDPAIFTVETRKALQELLAKHGFYESAIDGDYGDGTMRAIDLAFGLRN
ncbi:Uncharacterized protein, contains caspase domain [Sulfitobacter brevis]|uniref:Uncharacterized protein, contains caspase domain n=1 Tax=Sulfitobacter brevis TaxID=74348 RepID=A0A1I2FTM0_9RHOB|nr:caspase family protein [Sulfitobacter brevis]SFF08000.1 Uncharacterized protein, contains caspase domain [Sulfitobacter brevis]